ncbi:Oidioi.mRNA.OKI2018_I69.chr1.g475.t1.cds [Oikopleura dioica]|uniref:Hexosyltransferase n=1 Tax=Oikopleura dioica TaxID=34765 RepID=A0ABN7SNN8_OIKDI|nr:Oidioi.mRNA.OKI2018_I69.chr1.g475.t1.cds [Oikopleura dioica]
MFNLKEMRKYNTKKNRSLLIALFTSFFLVHFSVNVFKVHCYTGTDSFGCPQYGVPEKFMELWKGEKKNILKSYTCPPHGMDTILVTTTREKTDLHEKIYQFYTKRGFQVRFLIGSSDSPETTYPHRFRENYIIGEFEDRYENLHFKTFSAYQFVFFCYLQNANIIFLDDDTFFDPFEKIAYAPITCGHQRFKSETTWKKPFGKYHLSNEVWPDDYRYPTYCGGPCTIVSAATAEKLYHVASEIELADFNMEDVLFTGVYRSFANIPEPAENRKLCQHYSGDYNALISKYDSYLNI